MTGRIKRKLYKLKSIVGNSLAYFKMIFHPTRVDWENVTVDRGAFIEVDPTKISLGPGTIIESGAVLSTKYGGVIRLGGGVGSSPWPNDYDIWRGYNTW